MNHILRKVIRRYEDGGIRGLSRTLLDRLRKRSWSETVWLVYQHAMTGDADRGAGSLKRRELDLRGLMGVGYFKVQAYPEEIQRRFEDGNVCHAFCLGDRVATIGWSSPNYLELDSDIRYPCPGAVGLFDFITLDEFRARGFYTTALTQLASLMRDRGFAGTYIAVDPGNIASIRGIERAGFRPALQITRRWRLGVSAISERPSVTHESNDAGR